MKMAREDFGIHIEQPVRDLAGGRSRVGISPSFCAARRRGFSLFDPSCLQSLVVDLLEIHKAETGYVRGNCARAAWNAAGSVAGASEFAGERLASNSRSVSLR